ncbi:MAG: nuclear transport factor 2 family protein [Pseudomonas sp.]|uniref:nuclear transport factor 2 family protein n=1 Tax=Pseudomonas sp. TaxID=306 RepID=UPI0033939AC2
MSSLERPHADNPSRDGQITAFKAVLALMQDYFDGLYEADVDKLRGLFHPDAYLKAPGLRRSLEEWLSQVAARPVPKQQGDAYGFKVLALEVLEEQAMVKVDCPLLGQRYLDFLGLLKENGRWLIVNKMYAVA